MVTQQEQVQDVRQSIVETPGTFQYTCFHLEHNGERVNDFVELAEVKDLKQGSELVLLEDPYTEKEARMHVVRMRELVGATGERIDQLHGICAGLSLHDMIVAGEQQAGVQANGASNGTTNGATNGHHAQHALVGYSIDGPPSIETILSRKEEPLPKTVKSIAVSPWNPPPYHLRQRGHLLYLQVTTNEGEQHQITSTVSGFYVNKSSNNKFDPFPRSAPKNYQAHSLLSLISLLSPSFNSTFIELQELNNKKDVLTSFPFQNAMPVNPWLVPSSSSSPSQHQPDVTRAQEAYLLAGLDGAENLRDWNEEFQTARELPRENVQDRVFRERLTSKLFADYNEAAARGAMMIALGEVAPLNPTEVRDAQIFVYNNIFFSFGADGVQTFASEGGDEAARMAVGKDVAGVQAVNQLDLPGLYTPGTVVIDYLGKRIVGQSIVPGIFKQREPGEHQIDYGGVEGRDVVTKNEAFIPIFGKLSKALRVKKHAVWDKEGNRHDLEGSVETKGLLGTDGRKYVLDLYRITPLDIAWADDVSSVGTTEDKSYPHNMAILRLELVESYWRLKMQEYVKSELDARRAARVNGHNEVAKPDPKDEAKESSAVEEDGQVATNGDSGEQKDNEPFNGATEESKTEAPSEKENETILVDQERVDVSNFEFTLNPDVCSGQVPKTAEEKAQYEEDEAEVRAVCIHLRSKIIPELVQELFDSDVGFPMDGRSLSQLLHKRGINLRYMGRVATLAVEKGKRLETLVALAVQEMIARAFKHITNRYLRHLPAPFATSCVSHLLNCLLGSKLNPNPRPDVDESLREICSDGDFSFEKANPTIIKKDIETQVKLRYKYTLPDNWHTTMKPLQTLREIALKQGLQLSGKDYVFAREESRRTEVSPATSGSGDQPANGTHQSDGKKKKRKNGNAALTNGVSATASTTFSADDILNIAPIVKDAAPRSALAEEALEAGRISLAQGQKQLGMELVLESLSLHEQIYGILHPEVARIYRQISLIYHQSDEKDLAIELARKAVIVTERTLGVDSTDTILAYLNLALFEHSNGNTKHALVYVRHALDIWQIVYGPNHPDSITTMNNAAVMLQNLKFYPDSRRWFEASLAVCKDLTGEQSINTATILFQLAQALALDHDAKASVNTMRDSFNIFLSQLGPEDRNTKEAETWLEQLTGNAVSIAKHTKRLQDQRWRRVSVANRMSGTRPQTRVGQDPIESRNMVSSDSAFGASRVEVDPRSIDQLLKYIEGAEMSRDSPQAKQKKRSKAMNPKLRRAQEAAAA